MHLSALGIAISGAVTVAEILKNRNLAVEKKLGTSLEVLGDEFRCGLGEALGGVGSVSAGGFSGWLAALLSAGEAFCCEKCACGGWELLPEAQC